MADLSNTNTSKTVIWIVALITVFLAIITRCEQPNYLKFSSASSLELGSVAQMARSEMAMAYQPNQSVGSTQIVAIYEPSISIGIRQHFEENHNTFLTRMEKELSKPLVNIIYMKSRQWALQQVELLYPDSDYIKYEVTQELKDGGFFDQDGCDSESSIGMFFNHKQSPLIVISIECSWSDGKSQKLSKGYNTTVIHELVHFLQANWPEYELNRCELPLWFTEGQASFIATALTLKNDMPVFERARNDYLYYEMNGKLRDNEMISENIGEYGDGALAIEYLTGTYGWQKVRLLEQTAAKSSPNFCSKVTAMKHFASTFHDVFGKSLPAFYKDYKRYAESLL